MNNRAIFAGIATGLVFIGLAILAALVFAFITAKVPKDIVNIDKKHPQNNKATRNQNSQDVVLPELAGTIETKDVYMNNFGQFVACVSRDDITAWLDKNRNTKIISFTPINNLTGRTEKIIVLYNTGF